MPRSPPAARRGPAGGDTPVGERAAVLFRAAEWMRARRPELAALEVLEAGKPWAEADADVCEAIDFCEYYGRQMRRLDRGGEVDSPPGEANALRYEARGVGVVISPWNFPLAIPTGMVTAALVTGNAVCFKPAEQTPAIAYQLVLALEAGGLPPGVLSFLPGPGEDVGARLVEHPDVAFVAFTGSKAVGLDINERAARTVPGQRQVKRVVAEMGGKNAIIIDTDADLDQAVPAVVYSAFGYSGQKCSACSRLIVVGDVHDDVVERLVGATSVLRVGHPAAMGTDMGPLIDAEAHAKVRSYIEQAGREGRVVLQRDDVPTEGWFVGPTIVTDVAPTARVATEEVFGPLLTVLRARRSRPRHRAGQRHRLRPHRRDLLPQPGDHPPGLGAPAGRQRVRQPRHHRGGGRPPALRRLRPVGCGIQVGRPRLSAAVRGAEGRDREHPPPGVRPAD